MAGKKNASKIAILGWGSLIWDRWPDFDKHHEEWLPDGPVLKLEFSRISESRKGALTLVVDAVTGSECKTSYALSVRRNPDDAIADLRCREGTVMRRMGYYFRDGSRTCQPDIPDTIAPWAAEKGFDVVVWTGLPSNFKTYGPPHWQVGCVRLCSVVHKRIRRSGTLALAMMEIRASWSS